MMKRAATRAPLHPGLRPACQRLGRSEVSVGICLAVASMALGFAGCGAGVPVQLRLDEFAMELSIDPAIDAIAAQLLPPESAGLPEIWPEEFPDVCWDTILATPPELGGRIDLTPDPAEDPKAAELFEAVNNGLVDRIEIDRLIVRVEKNTLNVPLPPIELQAADAIDADPDDRRAWRAIGAVGGTALAPPCADEVATPVALQPGELADLEFQWARGGESFLDNQLADENCLARQMEGGAPANPLACKEFSLRARTRFTLRTAEQPLRPRGEVKLRLILVATFFVKPI